MLGDAVGGEVGVVGTAVGATVGGELVGTATVAVGDGGTAADGDVGTGAAAQAATKTTATMNTMMRFIGTLRLLKAYLYAS